MKTIISLILINILAMATVEANKSVRNYIDKKIIGKEAPGFQYIIADSTGILFEYYGGYADYSEKIPVGPETEFKVYSATKTFTALAIFQLIEQGKLSLDDEVGKVLNLPFSMPFTVRQVLSHTSGLTSTPLVTEIHPAEEHADFNAKANTERLLKENLKLKFTPGKKKKYSNFGYLVLGQIIEEVSGPDYREYITKNIFRVLGEAYPYGFAFSENTAKAYQKTSSLMHYLYGMIGDTRTYYDGKINGFMGYKDLYQNAYSYGGAFSSARGLLHYGQTLMQHDSPLLSDPYKNRLFEEQYINNGKRAKHSLGWFIKAYKGTVFYSHPGGGGGYSCEIRIYPESGVVSVYMMNTTQLFSHLRLLNKLDARFIGF